MGGLLVDALSPPRNSLLARWWRQQLTIVRASAWFAQLNLTLLHTAAAATGAVCLDGSSPGYYWRPGKGTNASKFLLVFQGGGWCKGVGRAGATAACADRATGTLGSSKHWSLTLREDAHG